MKGCSNSRKQLGGGSLAYTGAPVTTQPNPFLAYTGNGGSTQDSISLPASVDVMNPNLPYNPYGGNPALPNTGPIPLGNSTTPTNMSSIKYGGTCGACSNSTPLMSGGGCGCGIIKGGRKQSGGRKKNGGRRQSGRKQTGGQTIDPQGLAGSPWTSNPATWVGSAGNRNYLAYNDYKVDPQTALVSVGANRPFLFGGKKRSMSGKKTSMGRKTRRRQRGGALSNFLGQDFINLGRQVQYGIGSTYNGLNGYPAPTPVLPWQGQLPRTPNLYTVRGSAI